MRTKTSAIWCVCLLGLSLTAGCGGGAGSSGNNQPPPPPPPQPDFTFSLSTNSVTFSQGATSQPVAVSVQALQGFTGTVQVSLQGLPGGVASNPASPFGVTAGQPVSVVFGAASSAATGSYSITAQGTSGSLAHSAALSVTVESAAASNVPRTAFLRDDSQATSTIAPGTPPVRKIVFDSARKQIFVANEAMNRVEVYSSADHSKLAWIEAAGAESVDLSGDGATVWVGTSLEEIVAIDPVALVVKGRYALQALKPIPGLGFSRPLEVAGMSSGKAVVRMWQPGGVQTLLALWDPANNTLTDMTPLAPQVFQRGAGVMTRTGDHAHLFVAANDGSGNVAVFSASGSVEHGPQTIGGGAISFVAANADGSRYAAVLQGATATNVVLLDGSVNPLGSYTTAGASGIVFSTDGKKLFLAETSGSGRVVTALSATDLHSLGQIADAAVGEQFTELQEADDTEMLLGVANHGVLLLDGANPGTLPSIVPRFAAVQAVQPAEGPEAGGTSVTVSGQNFESSAAVRFGSSNAVTATSVSGNGLQVSSPPSVAAGAADVMAYFPSGWFALAPQAFSYGPAIERVLPNAGVAAGGDSVVLYGSGFGSDPSKVTVTIGGAQAAVLKLDSMQNAQATYPFAMQRMTVTTPAGASGSADIKVQAPSGTATLQRGFQYVASMKTYAQSELHKFVLYDQARQRVYLSATDRVDVFDLKLQTFVSPLLPPPNGPPPNSGVRGIAQTPDGTQLVVADYGAQKLYLIDPDGAAMNGTVVSTGGIAGASSSGPARVAATNAQTVFVAMSAEGGANGAACNACLSQLNLTANPPVIQPPPQPEVAYLSGAPELHATPAGDAVYFAFGGAPGGPLAKWSATNPGQLSVLDEGDSSSELLAAADGTVIGVRANGVMEVRRQDLSLLSIPVRSDVEAIPNRVAVPGLALHPTGALVFDPFLDGAPPVVGPATGIRGGIDVRDAHTGELRLRIYLPEPLAMLAGDVDGLHGEFLTVDETGQRLFAVTASGLTIVQLASLPLGIGSVSPATGPAAGGTVVTLRGSGIVSGTTVTIGGKGASVRYKDASTLQVTTPAMAAGTQRITLTNPRGETYSLDAAFTAQ